MSGDHDDIADLIPDYALGLLTEADRGRVAQHVETCAECRQAVQEITSVAEGLGQGLDPIDPPAALRAKVLAYATTSQGAATRGSQSHGGQTRWQWPTWLGAAASIAAVLSSLVAWNYRNDNAALRAELASVRSEVTSMAQQVATLEATANNARQTNAILTAVDLARVDLAGQTAAPVASGRVFWSASSGLVFSATNLPALPPGRVYQLWVVAEAPHSAGTITPDAMGRLSVVSGAPVGVRPKAFAVTIEPDGGRPAPTGPMFLLGSI